LEFWSEVYIDKYVFVLYSVVTDESK